MIEPTEPPCTGRALSPDAMGWLWCGLQIVLEGGPLDGQELHQAPSELITGKAGEQYELLTDRHGNPERHILGRLRHRLVWQLRPVPGDSGEPPQAWPTPWDE